MKVVKKKVDGVFTVFDVSVSSAEVSDALKEAAVAFARQMGLKPVPDKTIPQLAKEQLGINNLYETIAPQAVEILIPAAVNKTGITPAFPASIEPKTQFERGKSFAFEMRVMPKPSYELENYDPVSITIEPYKPNLEAIEQQISAMARAYTTYVKTDPAPLAAGMSCLIAMETTKDGEIVPGLTMESRSYTFGENLMPPGFDEALEGMEVGETRTATYMGPGLDENNNPIEEEFVSKVTLLEIQKEIVPVINDEWVKNNLPMYKDLETLKAAMGKEMDEERLRQYEDYKRSVAATELSQRFKGSIPDEIYEGSISETANRIRQQVVSQGISWEDFLSQNGGEQQVNMMLMLETRQQLVLGFALDAYYKAKGLSYTEEDLDDVCLAMNPSNPRAARESMDRMGFGYVLRESAERLRACKDLLEHAEITYTE